MKHEIEVDVPLEWADPPALDTASRRRRTRNEDWAHYTGHLEATSVINAGRAHGFVVSQRGSDAYLKFSNEEKNES